MRIVRTMYKFEYTIFGAQIFEDKVEEIFQKFELMICSL